MSPYRNRERGGRKTGRKQIQSCYFVWEWEIQPVPWLSKLFVADSDPESSTLTPDMIPERFLKSYYLSAKCDILFTGHYSLTQCYCFCLLIKDGYYQFCQKWKKIPAMNMTRFDCPCKLLDHSKNTYSKKRKAAALVTCKTVFLVRGLIH